MTNVDIICQHYQFSPHALHFFVRISLKRWKGKEGGVTRRTGGKHGMLGNGKMVARWRRWRTKRAGTARRILQLFYFYIFQLYSLKKASIDILLREQNTR